MYINQSYIYYINDKKKIRVGRREKILHSQSLLREKNINRVFSPIHSPFNGPDLSALSLNFQFN